MRSASFGHTTPAAVAAEANSSSPPGTNLRRRVMRAAWAMHRDCGGSFSDALRATWQHEKALLELSAASAFRNDPIDEAYIGKTLRDISNTYPTNSAILKTGSARNLLAYIIEILVNILDILDEDPDNDGDMSEFKSDNTDLPRLPYEDTPTANRSH